MFGELKDKLMEGVDLPMKIKGLKLDGDVDDDDTSTIGDSSLGGDLQDLQDRCDAKYAPTTPTQPEMEGDTPLVEMDATKPIVELPGDNKHAQVVELPADSKYDEVAELPADSELSSREDAISEKRWWEMQGRASGAGL